MLVLKIGKGVLLSSRLVVSMARGPLCSCRAFVTVRSFAPSSAISRRMACTSSGCVDSGHLHVQICSGLKNHHCFSLRPRAASFSPLSAESPCAHSHGPLQVSSGTPGSLVVQSCLSVHPPPGGLTALQFSILRSLEVSVRRELEESLSQFIVHEEGLCAQRQHPIRLHLSGIETKECFCWCLRFPSALGDVEHGVILNHFGLLLASVLLIDAVSSHRTAGCLWQNVDSDFVLWQQVARVATTVYLWTLNTVKFSVLSRREPLRLESDERRQNRSTQ